MPFSIRRRDKCTSPARECPDLSTSLRERAVLEVPGIPPGLFENVDYEMCTITLKKGDSVLFCTDGVIDAFSVEEESFGVARIQGICENCFCAAPTKLLTQIFAALANYTKGREQHDDMTAAVFCYEGSGGLVE